MQTSKMNGASGSTHRKLIATAVIALLTGAGIGYYISSGKSAAPSAAKPAVSEHKPLFYRNPMNPAVSSPLPAKDDMGMDYIPVYADAEVNGAAGTVRIDPVVVQDMGVRTIPVKRATLSRNIRTIGRIAVDEARVARLHPKYEGWVEKLFIDKTGEQIKQGSMLLSIYSPQLVATEEEYLLALDNEATLKNSPFPDVRDGAQSLLLSAKERLQLLDVPEHQINEIKSTHKIIKAMHIHSPFNGVVMSIGARAGERITPATELYMITDLSKI